MKTEVNASVLITGAAGVLGSALVDAFLDAGWTVFAGYHRTPVRRTHARLHPLPLDVTRSADWDTARERIAGETVPLQVIVHNAGISAEGLVPLLRVEAWDDAMRVMVTPVVEGTRILLPLLASADNAHVVIIGSHAARLAGTGQSAYAAAKSAVQGLAVSMAREFAPIPARVNVLLPGLLAGPLLDGIAPAERQRRVAANLLRNANDPAEVARFAVFLTSTRQISGQVFALDSRPIPWA